ncbi:sensor histidine kinase RegB [Aliiroseovarius crassostreae]|uniref:histidine kinase n=1 Tax=Aliiroseovarius crassostreae TaxID=154981 RepID=A0A9Q9LZB6_9RHOB|nr:ActS/PrrB/RegB family redox-sensitive histidine kinase [Aliiroseovarius crassostreae]UWP95313.1 ActS/PrrB/RegB family redox-sensitive histidine kinase [Aliiroseovarius crassostreae]UWP98473.1 ActS/PrrB/RegB family redox-sensitive histidine kinase [Aliiroseovarius crassostreae]
MSDPSQTPGVAPVGGQWVRLRTLIVLRWAAILGQIVAIVVAIRFFSLDINLLLVGIAISMGASANLIALAFYPRNARLNEQQATLWLLFDTLQLAFMVFLTGGLHNPFMVLIVAPVTVAATALSTRSTMVVGGAAVAATTIVADFNLPLQTQAGFALRMPEIFVFGLWVAVVVSIGFIGLYTRRISSEIKSMSEALLAAQMALAREQKLTDLGGVVAAAAHELGTPLATIKLVSSELVEELDGHPDLIEDARLINEQTDRCRDILRSMGRAGKDDMHMRFVPLSALVEAAAEPHMDRGKEISISIEGEETEQPILARRPEIIHGLRNLIQNAVDFASTAVWIDLSWTDRTITIRVIDDGRGYAPHLIDRIGDPFLRRRSSDPQNLQRREYEGMGLGLFIAKTLLERTGARLSFANGAEPYTGRPHPREKSGAIAQVNWRRGDSGLEQKENMQALGENQQFQ